MIEGQAANTAPSTAKGGNILTVQRLVDRLSPHFATARDKADQAGERLTSADDYANTES